MKNSLPPCKRPLDKRLLCKLLSAKLLSGKRLPNSLLANTLLESDAYAAAELTGVGPLLFRYNRMEEL